MSDYRKTGCFEVGVQTGDTISGRPFLYPSVARGDCRQANASNSPDKLELCKAKVTH